MEMPGWAAAAGGLIAIALYIVKILMAKTEQKEDQAKDVSAIQGKREDATRPSEDEAEALARLKAKVQGGSDAPKSPAS
jgi:hypothetical protein